jgi:hypothetical protein
MLRAIVPSLSLADLRRGWPAILRNLHEPPRKKRVYQRMAMIF